MTLEAAIVLGLGLFLGPVIANWIAARRPKDIVLSIQKTTNSASQPEIVTVQTSLRASATADEIWAVLEEKMAMPATARMVTVNEMILDHTQKISEEIAAQRPALKDKFMRKLEKRRRKYAAKTLGIPIDQVTDQQIQSLVQSQNGAPVE